MDSGVDSEVVFNTGEHEDHEDHEDQEKTPDSRTPPTPITQRDMDTIIRGWEEKFSKIVECLREVQLTSERASSDMCLVGQEARAQSQEHDRRLADFLRKFEGVDALRASTPRRYPTFGYQTSPVGREEVSHPPSSLPHFVSARTEDEEKTTNRATRCRTLVVRAQRNTRCSETRAPEITTMIGTRAPESQIIRATRCRTLVVRAQGNNCCSETHAPEITTMIAERRATGNRTTEETRAPYNFVSMTTKTTPRSHARLRVRKCLHSMDLTLPNFGLG